MFRYITDFNNRDDAPLSNENIREGIHKVIAEEESNVHNIGSDAHNVTADTFSQTSNTQRENENAILTIEKRDKPNKLAETLKDVQINDAKYYVPDSANENEAKGDPASNPKTFNHTSDGKKRKVTDTSNRILQHKILSNRTLWTVTMTMDSMIDNRTATCGGTPLTFATPRAKEVITDAARSSARVN